MQRTRAAAAHSYPSAEARTRELRQAWTLTFGRALASLATVYNLVAGVTIVGLGTFSRADWVVLVLSLLLAALVLFRQGVDLLAPSLLFALGAVLAFGASEIGYRGPIGAVLCVLPIATGVLLGRKWALFAIAFCCVGFVLLAALFAQGVLLSEPGFHPRAPAAWVTTALGTTAVTVSVVALLGRVVEDLGVVALEFDDAKAGLETAGKLRAAAEEARDRALHLRNQTRSVEALGVVAGSVVHDLNNMAQVIRTWADELTTPGTSTVTNEAAHGILTACDRLSGLSADVRGLNQPKSFIETPMNLAEALPQAARALRRFVRENIRIVVDTAVPDNLPTLALSESDLVHLVLEAGSAMSIAAISSGTLILSAPGPEAVDSPPPRSGMSRFPACLCLEMRKDGHIKSARAWLNQQEVPSDGKEVLCTAELRVILWCPTRDSACVAFDLFPNLSEQQSNARFPVLPDESTESGRT